MAGKLTETLATRFGPGVRAAETLEEHPALVAMAARGSCRHFSDTPVADGIIETLAAVALSAPSKSDLQQRDIIDVREPDLKARLLTLVADQDWTAEIPRLLVFCGNNRRQRQLHDWRGHPFANDHIDALFNAAVDAAIALAAFVTAAEAAGLGCCPISAIRNRAQEVSDLLALPDHVFPVAGLAVGHPLHPSPRVSLRLPLACTLHVDRFDETDVEARIADYDRRRQKSQPFRTQRRPDLFGEAPQYGWSEDKARQYALPERADFGAFVRRRGFSTE